MPALKLQCLCGSRTFHVDGIERGEVYCGECGSVHATWVPDLGRWDDAA